MRVYPGRTVRESPSASAEERGVGASPQLHRTADRQQLGDVVEREKPDHPPSVQDGGGAGPMPAQTRKGCVELLAGFFPRTRVVSQDA